MAQPLSVPAIVIVDDEPDILRLLKIFMQDIAPTMAILTAKDGESALQYLTEYTVPLLITDYMMPVMNDLELTAVVKAISPATHVIMITAYGSALLVQRARFSGRYLFGQRGNV
jgi:YesN/AraC family two-component response regulator